MPYSLGFFFLIDKMVSMPSILLFSVIFGEYMHVLIGAILILFFICVINLLKFSKMLKYDMTGIGLYLWEIPNKMVIIVECGSIIGLKKYHKQIDRGDVEYHIKYNSNAFC
jgi:hypothetical protein